MQGLGVKQGGTEHGGTEQRDVVEQGVVDQGRRGVGDAACRGGGGYSLGKAWVEIEQGEG